MAKYAEVGGQIRAHFRRLTPLVQPLSIDEAFLDVSHIAQAGQHTGHALNQLAEQILDDVGIGISIGLSHNKLLAKIASDLDNPTGFLSSGGKMERRSWPTNRFEFCGVSGPPWRGHWGPVVSKQSASYGPSC